MTARPPRPGALHTRKQDVVRTAISEAAIELFAGAGFEETTIDEIAAAAGVSTRTFFRYFASKADLLGQGMVRYRALLTEGIAAAPRGLGPLQVVRYAAERVATEGAAFPRIRQILQITSHSAAAREAQLARRAEVEDGLAKAFAARFPTRRRDNLMPRLLGGLTLSLLDVTFRVWSAGDKPITNALDDVFKALTAVVDEKAVQSR
ncbi:MAG: TetR family transcriptional regulator [Acidobacteriota bacterium]